MESRVFSVDFSNIKPGAKVSAVDNLLNAVDLVMVVTEKDRNHASEALRNLDNDIFSKDKFVMKSLPGKGNSNIKFVSFKDAMELVMVLPGKMAKDFRKRCADIIQRYIGGDETMVDEIRANAVSNAPINQMARAGMAAEMTQEEKEDRAMERKRKALEYELMEIEVKSRRNEAKMQEIECNKTLLSCMKEVSRDGILDERDRLMFKDLFFNLARPAAPSSTLAIEGPKQPKDITVSTVAASMGLFFDNGTLSQIGKEMKNEYVKKYNEPPKQHEQRVEGATRLVNSYTDKDEDMMRDVISRFAGKARRQSQSSQ